ncbi:MAG: hypothetical protein LBH09_06715 [Peptococcaceae bacterium]|nr:hypothetical protein [Peptococcaceae bacterium]
MDNKKTPKRLIVPEYNCQSPADVTLICAHTGKSFRVYRRGRLIITTIIIREYKLPIMSLPELFSTLYHRVWRLSSYRKNHCEKVFESSSDNLQLMKMGDHNV